MNDISELFETVEETEDKKTEIVEKIIEQLTSKKDIRTKTDISQREKLILSALEVFKDPFKYMSEKHNVLEDFITYYLQYALSVDRQSRKELITVIKSLTTTVEVEEQVGQAEELREKIRRLLLR